MEGSQGLRDDPLVETWLIHDRINRYLLDAAPDDALASALPKCRSVSDLFGHVHNVRLMWLKAAAPELLKGLEKLESKVVHGKDTLRASLEASGLAVADLLRKAVAGGARSRGSSRTRPRSSAT